jgi:ABC-type sugar transport system ATPase subunit
METRQPILELRGISKSFGFVEAVKNVDWQVYPGEVAALVGDNGANPR